MGEGNGAAKERGTVKFFNDQKDFGFIRPDNNGRDIFVHITAVQQAGRKTLQEGERVSYSKAPGMKPEKGPMAVDLEIIGEE